jgi:NAD+ kinase
MNSDPSAPKTIVIAAHPNMPEASRLAEAIASFLDDQGIPQLIGPVNAPDLQARISAGEFDLLIALGGDGTMLRAGQITAPWQVPILGINLGRFGFLTEVKRNAWQAAVGRVLAGDYWLEERMMLKVEHRRHGVFRGSWEVVNECVVGRGAIVRPVRLTTEVDDHYLTTYVADAVIVATPTGSTAYALAAGGPILPPELRNILIVPVAPHLSVDRAIVLHEGSWVRVTVRTDHNASLTIDGQPSVELMDKDQVLVKAGKHVVQFVRLQEPDYFYRNLTSRMNQNPSAEVDA